ncbi:MAG: alkaline phosphatase family protein, partial [Candidatus Binatia bacterium]
MGFLDRFKGRRGRRVLVIGLDGTPYSLIKELIECGEMPNLALVVANGSFKRMKSIYPTVSSVAWSSFMTGKNPAKHGIFGFIDLQPHSYKTFIPTSRTMRSETLWEILSKAGKRVVVINVPVTYPPREVNGILISGFLSPDIEKAVYPPAAVETLKRLDYIIDADPWAARESKDRALKEVNAALDSRVRALFHFLDDEEWDFFQCHIMATDRLHHFLWEQMEKGDEKYATYFFDFYRKIDEMLG